MNQKLIGKKTSDDRSSVSGRTTRLAFDEHGTAETKQHLRIANETPETAGNILNNDTMQTELICRLFLSSAGIRF